VARAISRPTVLDRYQPHRHRRWNQGCRDAAMLHAEITALGYRGSIRTVYRYLQPLRTGTDPTFTAGIRQDLATVTAGLSLPYSSGPTEGTSTGSKQSRGRCTAAPASTSCANASSITPRNPGHRIRIRIHARGRKPFRVVPCSWQATRPARSRYA
jgi:hypothetical protein